MGAVQAKPLALGAYIFAGGFTLGVRQHFQVIGHFEETPYGVDVFQRNHPDSYVSVGPKNWPVHHLKEELARQERSLELVYGNPPCAAWSALGRVVFQNDSAQWESDPRVTCTRIHFNLLELLRPKVWIWESVTAAWTRGRSLVEELAGRAAQLGYKTTVVLHDVANLPGGRQTRRRVFVTCHNIEIPWDLTLNERQLTASEVLRDYQRVKPKVETPIRTTLPRDFLAQVPPGLMLRASREKWIKKNPVIPGIGFAYHRVHPARPMRAVVGATHVHPTEPRFLNIQELLYATGYPVDYQLAGAPLAQGALIARGVCPPAGAWIASQVKRGLDSGSRPVEDTRLMVLDAIHGPRATVHHAIQQGDLR